MSLARFNSWDEPKLPEVPRARSTAALWRAKVKKHGLLYFAVAPTPEQSPNAPKVREVPHQISAVFKRGWRTYAFLLQTDRDNFLATYPEASLCENPRP